MRWQSNLLIELHWPRWSRRRDWLWKRDYVPSMYSGPGKPSRRALRNLRNGWHLRTPILRIHNHRIR